MKKILILDDETSLREALAELLMLKGFVVFDAENGEEGLKIVQKFQPNIILCDIMMPVLDGYQFMEKHFKSKFSKIPILLLSAKVEKEDKEKGIALGAKDVINKPFVFSELKK